METMLEVTDKQPPFNENPSPLLNFLNVNPSYMATFHFLDSR